MYNITLNNPSQSENKAQFQRVVRENIHRDGIDDLMNYLEESDFYEAPASTRFHGNFAGGLCLHSLSVARNLAQIADVFAPGKYSNESLAIVALFHDLCKIGVYKTEMRNVKNARGEWERVPFYKFDEDFSFGGHGSKSVYLAMKYIKLTDEEAVAINSHMGFAGEQNIAPIGDAYNKSNLAWMLHVADEAATYIDKI